MGKSRGAKLIYSFTDGAFVIERWERMSEGTWFYAGLLDKIVNGVTIIRQFRTRASARKAASRWKRGVKA